MDWNPDFRKIGMEGLVLLINGPDEGRARRAQAGQGRRRMGQDLSHRRCRRARHQRPSHAVHDLRGDARRRGRGAQSPAEGHRAIAAPPRGSRTRLRAGYDTLEHGTFMDAEALDMLLERDTPVVPALQFEYASIERGPEFGMPQAVIDGHQGNARRGRRRAHA